MDKAIKQLFEGRNKKMKAGDQIRTPRFCTVKIEKIFESKEEAFKNGFSEPTYYKDCQWDVLGKSIDMYHMEFAAVRK